MTNSTHLEFARPVPGSLERFGTRSYVRCPRFNELFGPQYQFMLGRAFRYVANGLTIKRTSFLETR